MPCMYLIVAEDSESKLEFVFRKKECKNDGMSMLIKCNVRARLPVCLVLPDRAEATSAELPESLSRTSPTFRNRSIDRCSTFAAFCGGVLVGVVTDDSPFVAETARMHEMREGRQHRRSPLSDLTPMMDTPHHTDDECGGAVHCSTQPKPCHAAVRSSTQ